LAHCLNGDRRHAANPSLNAAQAAPIKSGKKKLDHSSLTCHYCQKKGHIKPNCQKKKWDEVEKKKKEEGSSASGSKSANSHVLVETTASIMEVADNEITASLYATWSDRWMLDSRATHHITPHRSDFSSYTPAKGSVCLGDKSAQDQIGVGSVVIKSPQGCTITLSHVLHVLDVQTRFISIGALTGKGAKVQFLEDGFKIALNGRTIVIGYLEGHLYWLNSSSVSLNSHIKSAPTLHTWHQRMGHMSHVALKNHGPKAVTGLDLDVSSMAIPTTCHGCETGKSTCKPFPGSAKTTSRILEVVHSDLAGPMQVKSIQGSLYTATFIDDYSRHVVVYCLRLKDQFAKALQKFLSWAETQTSEKLCALHSDRGGEYMAASVKDVLNQRGIEHHLTMPGTPQQNGKAEQFNHTIMDKAMSMLHNAGLSNGFWELAISTAIHIYNHTPIRSLKWHTPHEAWNAGHIPDVSYFRVFGCKAYMHVPADKWRKLDAKATEVTFVRF
jgi:transposase InsO family protein